MSHKPGVKFVLNAAIRNDFNGQKVVVLDQEYDNPHELMNDVNALNGKLNGGYVGIYNVCVVQTSKFLSRAKAG